MKRIYVLLIIVFSFFIHSSSYAQAGQWVWIKGTNMPGDTGNHGIRGVPSPINNPRSLYEACEWTDLNGNLWLYGGGSTYNDLWKYDPTGNEWTWMTGSNASNDLGNYGIKGVPSPSNRPPSKGYGIMTWTDLNGNLWMFGGSINISPYRTSDLWKYDISTNQWTWMKGPSALGQPGVYGTQGVPDPANYPGARDENAATWVDKNGDLWLFGGCWYNGSYNSFNDLWRYNIATNTWTWMKGSQLLNQPGVYGVKGVEDTANTPGGRWTYSRWKDTNGNLWIFGGREGLNAIYHNDLWRYNPVTNSWTWMNGDATSNSPGIYGTQCITDSLSKPGARYENRAMMTDQNGNFWLFGGNGYGTSGGGYLNDLWMYCVATNRWTWESGDNTINATANWGTQGVSSPTNKPDGRMGAATWSDYNGHLYMFGGFGGENDLWKYTIDPNCGACGQSLPVANFTSSDTAFCTETGKCIDFYDHSTGNPTSWQWIFSGATPSASSLQNPTNICYYNPGTYEVKLIISNGAGSDTLDVLPHIIFRTAPPPPTINVIGGDTLISSHTSYYQWYRDGLPIAGAIDSFYIAMQGGTYSVQGTDSLGCTSISTGVLVTGLTSFFFAEGPGMRLFPNPVTDELTISFSPLLGRGAGGEAVITDIIGNELIRKSINESKSVQTLSVKNLSNGIYFLQLRIGGQTVNKKFVVQHN